MSFEREDLGIFVKELPNSGGFSVWFPAHNPVITRLRREDEVIIATSDNAGSTQIQVGTGGVASVGSLVFINTVLAGGTIEAVYTVTSIVDAQNFVIDLPYNGTPENGYVNYNSDRINYYFLVRLMQYDENDNPIVVGQPMKYVPFANGLAYTDISAMLRKTVSMDDDYLYETINEADRNLSSRLVLDFSESYNGTAQAFELGFQSNIYAVNAALQVSSRFGANMTEYVTEPTGADLAKFLTKFERPTAWAGLPFDMQFVFSDILEESINASPSDFIHLRTREVFIPDDGIVVAFEDIMDATQYFYVNRVRLRAACNPTSHSSVARTIEYSIRYRTGTFGYTTITETKTIKMVQTIPCNPVYLKWINTNGGWDYWCFSFAQDEGLAVQAGEQFSKFFLPTADGFPNIGRDEKNFLTKNATPTLTIGADGLDAFDKAGLQNLLYSPKVVMLQNIDDWDTESSPTNDPKWLTVLVEPGTFKFGKTNESKFSLQLTIQLTELEIQSQ